MASQPDTGTETGTAPLAVVLGTAQDAGFPAAGCSGPCCKQARQRPELRRLAAALGLIDPQTGERWLIDCTPDFREQLVMLDSVRTGVERSRVNAGITGILLTHAHIGHYLGLAQLGREGLDASALPLYAMPRMAGFLQGNQPWRQLVELGQIGLEPLSAGQPVTLGQRLTVTPVEVPHRGEHSETVGFLITGPSKSVFYLPDIDGWAAWSNGIQRMLRLADVLYLDGTFYSADELPGRDMSIILHPSISGSLELFSGLPADQRSKIRFIHFNHTNPVLDPSSDQSRQVRDAGFGLAEQGEKMVL